MNLTEWNGYRNDFKQHFFLGENGPYLPDPTFEFNWSALKAHYDAHQSNSTPQPAKGIAFSYGLKNDQFSLVVELYGLDANNKPVIINGTGRNAEWQVVDDTTRKTLQQAYIEQVWVKPFATGDRRRIVRPTATNIYGDVVGIHYPWTKIDKLFNDNGGPGHVQPLIVAACISAELTDTETERKSWKALGEPDVPKFRHILSLHMAVRGITGQRIDHISDDPSGNYAMRAVDYGSVCPANCPKRSAE